MAPLRLFKKKPHQNPDLVAEDHEIISSGLAAGRLTNQPVSVEKGLDTVYAFFLNDYEPRGCNDALTNPDESYKSDNITLLRTRSTNPALLRVLDLLAITNLQSCRM